MIEAEGFEVTDLGIDVPPEEFVSKVREIKPQIIAMSGVLTLAVESMKKTVDALKEAGLRDQVKILIGGNAINRDIFKYIGADAFSNNADEGVIDCRNCHGIRRDARKPSISSYKFSSSSLWRENVYTNQLPFRDETAVTLLNSQAQGSAIS
jgi:hypothetical protein